MSFSVIRLILRDHLSSSISASFISLVSFRSERVYPAIHLFGCNFFYGVNIQM